ncbi:type II secretion system F family protein [Fervidibacter sacchari]|jgi:Flp pilus assembly protein TadB|uniref:Tight adherence protein B n=1 Tax=Candidatus Fervidibacter sacchari TaxID=1448929 RepID=A0ABT2EPT0_9BACT|nr:type II secretion system F family protein [Candidatus Fervidibacter sacchari]MCS3919973.1 tight adherence protein B [Candidatus Fervidibacter sacchari]WKU16792.1 type II secretion system F family protein [Candidatus Fervidibacter sacchari]
MTETTETTILVEEKERFPLLTRLFSKTRWARIYSRKMMEAGLPIRGEEFLIFLLFTVVGLASIIAIFTKHFIGFLIGGFIGFAFPNWALQWQINRRKTLLENQLADALTIISAGLSAGYSFLQSARLAADQLPPPISEELDRVVRLSSLGMPVEQALQIMAERVQSYDYDITVSAILVQLRRGGNLSRILSTVADTIRQRIELRGEIAASTAQARFSGWILMGLPFAVATLVFIINPTWMRLLLDTELGRKMILTGLVMQAMGMFWIRRLLQVEL